MKFKRIEIQAFKAYNDLKDGTFDFTTLSNEVADFVSIYAPNGFGKSSFFDAIEWAFTNQISHDDETEKDDSPESLINKEALQEKKDGFVKIYVTSSQAPVSNHLSKGKTEAKNDRPKNNYFQEVLLLQERIDAFLKEKDATLRYNKFMRFFGDKRLHNIYKLLVEIIQWNNREIEILERVIKRLKEISQRLTPDAQKGLQFEFEKAIAEKDLIESQLKPLLEQERQALADYLEKQIGAFFDIQLINALYRKIIPHPKHKVFYFKSDFCTDRSCLNLFVTGENDGEPLVPTRYFSASQLNILSLCIFLSKALKIKDDDGNPVDCIFIDDPIQSLDSINILSTIDLLRSVVVCSGKQIILTTHDENFHQLLQKKIPPDKFRAVYIELESLGKIKQTF